MSQNSELPGQRPSASQDVSPWQDEPSATGQRDSLPDVIDDAKKENFDSVTCRYDNGSRWVGGIIGLPISLICFAAVAVAAVVRESGWPWLILMSSVMGVFFLAMPISVFSFAVESDQNGLRWRTFGPRWRQASWAEVTDYYRPATNPKRKFVVETVHGNIRFGDDYVNGMALAEATQNHAQLARAKSWEVEGERDVDDWPRDFSVVNGEIALAWTMAIIVLVQMITLLAIPLSVFLSPEIRPFYSPGIVILSSVLAATAILFLIKLSWRPLALRKRRAEKLLLSPDKIEYQSGSETTLAPWAEIDGWEMLPTGDYCLVAGEKKLPLPTKAVGYRSVVRLLEKFAPQLGFPDEDEMSLRPSDRRTSSKSSIPDRFSYRSLGTRMFLMMGFLLPTIPGMFAILQSMGDETGTPLIWWFVAGSSLYLLGIWIYRTAYLKLDESGIQIRVLGWRNDIPWDSIQAVKERENSLTVLQTKSGDRRPEWCFFPLARRQEFWAEVKRRIQAEEAN